MNIEPLEKVLVEYEIHETILDPVLRKIQEKYYNSTVYFGIEYPILNQIPRVELVSYLFSL